MKILFTKGEEPPDMLTNLITRTISGKEPQEAESRPFQLETMEFVVNHFINGALAIFIPGSKKIVMDLGNCLTNQNFMKQGLMWIPSIWFNMLFAFYHELGHVIQMEENPKLAKREEPTKAMEKDADTFAIGCVKDWTKDTNNKMPTLDEMGWIGRQIKKAANLYYPSTLFNAILSEIKPCESGGVGRISTMAAYQEAIAEAEEELYQDEGFGIVVDGKKYMTAEEFFDTTYSDI